jgi:hypothetical protein
MTTTEVSIVSCLFYKYQRMRRLLNSHRSGKRKITQMRERIQTRERKDLVLLSLQIQEWNLLTN